MASAERLVETWMASARDEEIEQTVSEISNDRIALLDVVKALGEYLTSEEDQLRAKGVELLSSVLSRLPTEKLNRQSVRVLTTFYCGKLDDTETIIPALKGLNTLTTLPTCSSTEASSIMEALFTHVKMRALVHSVRFQVFSIIDNLIARHRAALKAMGKTFVARYISLVEGEKDPRNLLVAFAIARVILIEFDISDHVESLFNITFCYFPITFRPPPNDPYGITTEDLQKSLRGCLNASPSFGPLAIPLFLEKLAAGSPATKRDTLQTMAISLPVYGSALARVSARKLWNSLKLEIFQPTDPLTEAEALKTTQTLVETIYSHEEDAIESEDDIQGLARDVCEECIHILREPEKNQARPAIKVLCAFLATTPSVARYTLSHAVPHLIKLFLDPGEASNRPPILLLLADLVTAARDSMPEEVTDDTPVPMSPYKDEVLGVVSVGLKATVSRIPALALLRGMITTGNLFPDQELGFIVHLVNEVFQAEDAENDDFSDSAILDVLTTISKTSPLHVQEQTLPMLFSSLPEQAPPREATSERIKNWRTLLALKTLCVHPQLFEILAIRLTTKVDLLCAPAMKRDAMEDTEPDAAYAHSLLKTIADTLSTKVDAGHPDVAKYIDRLVPGLYNLFIFSALRSEMSAQGKITTEPRLVRTAGEIITLVTQCVPAQRQASFVSAIFEVLSLGRVQGIADGLQKLAADEKVLLFEESAPTARKNLLALFSAGIVTAHKEVLPSPQELDAFLNQLLIWSVTRADHYLQRESAWHIIASIVNKQADSATAFLEDKLDNFWPHYIAARGLSPEQRRYAIQAWVWMSKALVVRKEPSLARFTDRLFEVFSDDEIAWDAARALGEFASPDQILIKRHHAVIKILHAQKFVNGVLPRIILGAQDSSKPPHEQTAYLVALTSLIKAIPKASYAHEMPSLMPLVLRGLELPDFDIRADVIDTLLAAAEGDVAAQNLVTEHTSTLVTAMLKNSMVNEMPSVRVRTAALKYLGVLPKIVRYDVLHPSKPTVLRELAKVLDDPKRSVRREAVDTRTVWFKYSG
ncbi:putative RNAPII transcription regulator C-terminal [Lyophyllum shimeji]|uniref:MMS19 nucleotide excision repair protein n=1 Tax=Lyophyllum shimeji TaxID=47721 RepID=A0A9P3UR40_LYOSH|nr:putative RNAPII transcription regulator C-terminal [Lyophyllum shimeji]